jgi:lysyl endopeptidase
LLLPELQLEAQERALRWPDPASQVLDSIPLLRLPGLDNVELQTQEYRARRLGRAPVFAASRELGLNPSNSGFWEVQEKGEQVWRLRIISPGAFSLNFGFSAFHLPEGALFRMYDKSGENILGPFSLADEDPHGTFWTPILPGEEAWLELKLPTGVEREEVLLELKHLNHDFIDLPSMLSGNCNIDIACLSGTGFPQLAAFREAAQAVVYYTLNGKSNCTGFLINNTANDCRPYLITARHCEVDSASAPSMVVYWNYQNSQCREQGSSANGRQGDGKLNRFNTGAIFRAAHVPSDVALVELDDPLHPEANAFFLGWSLDTLFPTDGVAILHHPASEEKRISYSSQRPYRGAWGQGATPVPGGNHLIIPRWDLGSTEDGSSGGPLVNRRQQALGSLHGGAASCGNALFDAFGWLGTAWEGGGTASTRLKNWLDPRNIAQRSWPGRWAYRCDKRIQGTNLLSLCQGSIGNVELSANNAFLNPVQLRIVSLPAFLNARLEPSVIKPGEKATLRVSTLPNAPETRVVLSIIASDGEDTVTLALTVEVKGLPQAPQQVYPTAGQQETPVQPTLRWKASPGATQYRVRIAANEGFQQILQDTVVRDTFFRSDPLSFETTIFWEITPVNACGSGSTVRSSFITVPDFRFEIRGLPQESCNQGILSFELYIGKGFGRNIELRHLSEVAPALVVGIESDSLYPGATVRGRLYNLEALRGDTLFLHFQLRDGKVEVFARTEMRIKRPPPVVRLISGHPDTAFLISRPILRWEKQTNGLTYTLEISKTRTFDELLQRFVLEGQTSRQIDSLPPGEYFWRVWSSNECGAQASEIRRFTVHTTNQGNLFNLKVAIDPNPTNGNLQVLLSAPVRETGVSLYTLSGQLLQAEEDNRERSSYNLDLSKYPNGAYIVRVRYRQTSFSRLVILQR